jgi:hypothetical protein
MFVCLFVCTLYKSTFLNQLEPNWAHGSLLVWKRPQGMYRPEILDLFDLLGPFSLGAAHGHKMAAVATVFRDTLISVVLAGVLVTSPTLRCRWQRSHTQQSYIRDSSGSSPYILADDRVIRYSVLSLILVGVCVTSWTLRSTGRRAHPPQHYIPHSSSCFCGLQKITSLQTTQIENYRPISLLPAFSKIF